jgi:hypothetical protein
MTWILPIGRPIASQFRFGGYAACKAQAVSAIYHARVTTIGAAIVSPKENGQSG